MERDEFRAVATRIMGLKMTRPNKLERTLRLRLSRRHRASATVRSGAHSLLVLVVLDVLVELGDAALVREPERLARRLDHARRAVEGAELAFSSDGGEG